MNLPPEDFVTVHEDRLLAAAAACLEQAGLEAAHAVVVNGDGALGHMPTVRATEMAVTKAKEVGIGMGLVRSTGLYGSAIHYTRMCMDNGFVGFSVQGPEGYADYESSPRNRLDRNRPNKPSLARFGWPPLSFALPSGVEPPVVLDAGTPTMAGGFFLSPEGHLDPQAELTATISAYFRPGVVDDYHPRCRFPARYYWLSHQLELPGYQARDQCEKIEKWELFDETRSVSLLMVSGYLGNPASTFGHSLLKLNTPGSDGLPSLSDPTVNFGAMVPERVNPMLYIFHGLTGGFGASFSDKFYYSQDLVYSRTEFRDMWEFRLDLTEYERVLLWLHISEIVGQTYKYYFFDRNCGFRLAELLDLVIEEDLLDLTVPWYAPVDLFHELEEINRSRIRASQPELITSVSFIPSARRKLFHQLSALDDTEIRILNRLLDEGPASIDGQLNGLRMDRQIDVLNGVLAYYRYRDTAGGPNQSPEPSPDPSPDPSPGPSAANRADQGQVLLARLRRPARPVTPPPVPDLVPPTLGFRPMATSIGAGREPGKDLFTRLAWAPYKKESGGHNSMEGGELVVADIEMGLRGNGLDDLFLSHLDVIRLLSLSTMPMRIMKDRGLSWRLRIGVDGESSRSGTAYDGVFSFGAGKAWKASPRLTGFGLLNLDVHTRGTLARVGPELRLLADLGSLRATAGLDLMSTGYAGQLHWRGNWRLLYRLSERQSLEAEHRPGSGVTTMGLSRYF